MNGQKHTKLLLHKTPHHPVKTEANLIKQAKTFNLQNISNRPRHQGHL